MSGSTSKKMEIIIIHPDLGIGGAERLIVDIAKAMKVLGHSVKLYTSHHDPSRCFEETRGDGVIADCIEVHGNWLPRQIFGRCTALCAIVRMIYVSFVAVFGHYVGKSKPSLIFLDSVSAPIPLFKMFGIPSMFYCHFPDKLLCTDRGNFFKRMYRILIDNFEESSTGCANEIVVNSLFTAGVFADNFLQLGKLLEPQVLYPTIELPDVVASDTAKRDIAYTDGYDLIFASLNRYERKKNIGLAIRAFDLLLQEMKTKHGKKNKVPRVLLVVAGGYDDRVVENVEHYKELQELATSCGIEVANNVVFRRSISDAERNALLTCATAILYTPANEHFGIVPLEAMCRLTPVVAVSSGGPLETVLNKKSGFLCEETPESFMNALLQFVQDESLSSRMGAQGRKHVEDTFTFDAMVPQLEGCLQSAARKSREAQPREDKFLSQLIFTIGMIIAVVVAVVCGAYVYV